jgi:allophanate hydrolase
VPLNAELVERCGRLVARTRTAPCYRLYALPGGPPLRPGLLRANRGAAIEVEVWELPVAALGSLIQDVPAPLSIGTLTLDDGTTVKGFLAGARASAAGAAFSPRGAQPTGSGAPASEHPARDGRFFLMLTPRIGFEVEAFAPAAEPAVT